VEAFSTVSHRQWCVKLCPLPCTSGIVNIGACLRPLTHSRVSGKPDPHTAMVVLTSSLAFIFLLDDYLDVLPPIFIYSAFTYTPPPLAPTMGRSLPYSRYLQFLRLFGTVPHDSCGSFLSVVMYLFPINLVGARHITWNACCLISAFKREVVFP